MNGVFQRKEELALSPVRAQLCASSHLMDRPKWGTFPTENTTQLTLRLHMTRLSRMLAFAPRPRGHMIVAFPGAIFQRVDRRWCLPPSRDIMQLSIDSSTSSRDSEKARFWFRTYFVLDLTTTLPPSTACYLPFDHKPRTQLVHNIVCPLHCFIH